MSLGWSGQGWIPREGRILGRERPEMQNTEGDGGRACKLLWPESRALWETLTTTQEVG